MANGTIVLTSTAIAENSPENTVIGTLSVTGANSGETFTFALGSSFADRFAINGNDLIVKNPTLFDYETLNSMLISISATSTAQGGTHVNDAPFTINITDVNETPTGLTVTGGRVADNATVGTEVATLLGLDPDAGETFTYSLVQDDTGAAALTNSSFEIVGDKIKLKSALDQSQVGSQTLWVKVTDHAGLSVVKQVTISVLDAKVGTAKNDKLYGTEGADSLDGGAGNDKIYGSGGDDVINGGLGKDILYGGTGKDTFVFNTPVKKGHFDQVMDFNSADDTLQFNISALQSLKVKAYGHDVGLSEKGKPVKKFFSFDKIVKAGKLEKDYFAVGKAKDGNDFIVYNQKNGFVYFDADGSGKGKGVEILKLKPGTALTADDFLFI